MWKRLISEEDSFKKGELFETFCLDIFSKYKGLKRGRINVFTNTSEIDIVFDIIESQECRFDGNHLIIQCKNFNKTIGVGVLSHLYVELLVRKANYGILATTRFISDEARVRTKELYDIDGKIIMMIEGNDFLNLLNNKISLEELIEKKYNEVVFPTKKAKSKSIGQIIKLSKNISFRQLSKKTNVSYESIKRLTSYIPSDFPLKVTKRSLKIENDKLEQRHVEFIEKAFIRIKSFKEELQ